MPAFLTDLALAHQTHEGWFPGSLSQRNANPGNLRLTPYQMAAYGAAKGAGGFARFPTYAQGFQALIDDLRAKITGRSAHIDYTRNPKLLDYVRVYAPRGDGNNPENYAAAVVAELQAKGYDISIHTPLSTLAQWILTGVTNRIRNPNAARRRAARIAEDSPEPKKSRILKRLSPPHR